MKITDVQIDGFGVWSGLNLNGLSPEITVFYGPNEAGKSTLLQFVRAVCFGYSPERRRYLPPTHGGRAGGSLGIASGNHRFQVARFDDGHGGHTLGGVQVIADDGRKQSDATWRSLLDGVDEPTFNNVFAVGLRDLQELNTLSDTDAAQHLYDISAGRDRVSLGEVLRELETSRHRIIGGTPEKSSLIGELTTQRDRLRSEIDDLQGRTPRLGRAAAQMTSLKQECDHLEQEISHLQQQLRIFDLSGSLRPKWLERQNVDHELSLLGPVESIPPELLSRLDRLNLRLKKSRKRHARTVGELRLAHGEAKALTLDDGLWKQAPRIEVLAEQIPFIQQLEKQIDTLDTELADLEHRYQLRRQQLGISTHGPSATSALISAASAISASAGPTSSIHGTAGGPIRRGWSYFRPTASRLRDARRHHLEAQEELNRHSKKATEVKTQVNSKLGNRTPNEITTDLDKAGKLVTQLRRRLQLESQLKLLGQQQTDLDGNVEAAYEEILLPPQFLFGLGGLFILGVVLILTGIFYPTSAIGRWGWWISLSGLAGTAIAGAFKWYYEYRAEEFAGNFERQKDTLAQQIKEAEEERDEIDGQLPKGGGELTSRLQAAEAQLASLQELLPLHTQKESTEHHVRSVEERARNAEAEYTKAKQSWRKLLRTAGLEETLSPADVAQRTREEDHRVQSHHHLQAQNEREQQKAALEHAAKREELSGTEQLMQTKREEIANRRREHEAVTMRVKQLLHDAGLLVGGRNPFEQLVQLRRDVDEQKALRARRRSLHRRRKSLKETVRQHAAHLAKVRKHRQKLLRTAGVANYADVQRRSSQFAKYEMLRKQRDVLTHDMTTALAGAFPESLLHEHLDANPQTFDARRAETDQRFQAAQQRYASLLQQRGELSAQSKSLLEDRRLQHKQLELGCLEQKLAEAAERWHVLSATTNLLEHTRREFETERQPETLREASDYFQRLTEGRYRRVWTPLDDSILKVDDAEGHTVSVDKLSCGTREQLFLSLRLALAALYSRRGAHLPLVLDDVLVNYDTQRAKAAAQVLKDFAAKGHQLLVFTCHEHILDLFADIGVDARCLPVNGVRDQTVEPAVHQPAKRRPRRERVAKRELVHMEEPVVEQPLPPPPPVRKYVPLPVVEMPAVQLPVPQPKPEIPVIVVDKPTPAPRPAPPVVRRQPTLRVERLAAELVAAPVVIAPPAPLPRAVPLVETARVRPLAEHRRIDPPQERSMIYLHRNKWTAEEFDGELEDWVAVRNREEALARVATVTQPVVSVRQGYAPDIIIEQREEVRTFDRRDHDVDHKDVVGPRSSRRTRPVPLNDDDLLGIA